MPSQIREGNENKTSHFIDFNIETKEIRSSSNRKKKRENAEMVYSLDVRLTTGVSP